MNSKLAPQDPFAAQVVGAPASPSKSGPGFSSGKQGQGAWFALWILFGINAMNFYDRQILAAVAEPIRKEWALNDTMLGTLATAFTLIYAAVGLPLGRLADSWSRSKLLALGVAAWSA